MNYEFQICDKCKGTNKKTLIPKLKEMVPEANIIIGCANLCGIGRNKSFVILNHVPIIADTEEELIKKVRQQIS